MPFVPTVMANLMRAKAVPSKILGSKSTPLLSAVSSAVCSYVPAAAVVVSTNMVTGPGSGTMTGKIVGCVPSAMSSMMVMKATSLGLRGRDMARLFDAISFGVCQVLQTLSVAQGTVIGGGPGAGTAPCWIAGPRRLAGGAPWQSRRRSSAGPSTRSSAVTTRRSGGETRQETRIWSCTSGSTWGPTGGCGSR